VRDLARFAGKVGAVFIVAAFLLAAVIFAAVRTVIAWVRS
jgi:hypothetical protein